MSAVGRRFVNLNQRALVTGFVITRVVMSLAQVGRKEEVDVVGVDRHKSSCQFQSPLLYVALPT